MARNKIKTDDDFMTEIIGSTGGISLRAAGEVPYFIDTGNLALNFQMSGKFIAGGWPGGRIIEAFGPEASGKSLLGYGFLGSVQRMGGIPVLLDCERAASPDFAERCGHVNADYLPVYEPITLEQVEKKVVTVVQKIREVYPDLPIGIMWDSIGVCPCDREWEESEIGENPTKEDLAKLKELGKERPGERAKTTNKILRSLNPFLNKNNATFYVINQIRKKVGFFIGSDEALAGGGEALKFYASCRFRTAAPKAFQDKAKFPLGIHMTVTNKKNRHHVPGIKIENIPMFFDSGINPLAGLVQALEMARRITFKSGGNWIIEPEFTTEGEKNTFRCAKASPLQPEVILVHPKLIDAESEDQIKSYLTEWADALELTETAIEV
jgi:recombination protein RecA